MRTGLVVWILGVSWLSCGAGAILAQQSSVEAEQVAAERQQQERRRRRPVTRKTALLGLEEGEVKVAYGLAKVDGPDFGKVGSLGAGDVIPFTQHAAIKLSTPLDLMFGDLRIESENVAEGYPGVYSLWLERSSAGWSLIFNEKADVWGTQHRPEADVGKVTLVHEAAEEATETFTTELVKVGEGGLLVFLWGEHRWSVPFTTAP